MCGCHAGACTDPAFDLAVACGLQQGHAAVAAADGGRAAVYEGRKNQRLQTLTTCKDFFFKVGVYFLKVGVGTWTYFRTTGLQSQNG